MPSSYAAFAAGWIYGITEQVKRLGWAPVLTYMGANFGSVALACGIWFGVPKDDGGVWGGFVALILFYLVGLAVTLFLLKQKMDEEPNKWTRKTIMWEISFKNIYDLTKRIKPVIGWYPFIWCFLVKQFIPHVLLILFVNLARSNNGYGDPIFGHYGGFATTPYQVLGVLSFVFAATLFTVGFIFPKIYYPLRLPEGHFGLDPEGERAKQDNKEVEVQVEKQEEGEKPSEEPAKDEESVEA